MKSDLGSLLELIRTHVLVNNNEGKSNNNYSESNNNDGKSNNNDGISNNNDGISNNNNNLKIFRCFRISNVRFRHRIFLSSAHSL